MLPQLPKIIFIDWNGTLSKSRFWQQLSDPKNELNKIYQSIEKWFFEKNNELLDDWMLGKKNARQVCYILGARWKINHQVLYKNLIVSCRQMRIFDQKAEKIIRAIKKQGTKVLVASDNMDVFRDFTIPALKLDKIFDNFLLSNEVGCFKYSVQKNKLPFFESYLASQDKSYQEVVLLDDSPDKNNILQKFKFPLIKIKSPGFLHLELKKLLFKS
jgi:FMN phosphatase YigB (HAD superfamily)